MRRAEKWNTEPRPLSGDPRAVWFGTRAAFDAGGAIWKTWNADLKLSVVDNQVIQSPAEEGHHRCGSWDLPSAAARAEGRLRTTAFMDLTLEVYYRYGRVFGSR